MDHRLFFLRFFFFCRIKRIFAAISNALSLALKFVEEVSDVEVEVDDEEFGCAIDAADADAVNADNDNGDEPMLNTSLFVSIPVVSVSVVAAAGVCLVLVS